MRWVKLLLSFLRHDWAKEQAELDAHARNEARNAIECSRKAILNGEMKWGVKRREQEAND